MTVTVANDNQEQDEGLERQKEREEKEGVRGRRERGKRVRKRRERGQRSPFPGPVLSGI